MKKEKGDADTVEGIEVTAEVVKDILRVIAKEAFDQDRVENSEADLEAAMQGAVTFLMTL